MKQGRLILIGALLVPGLVFAQTETNQGKTPKGKPFVEIQGQFVEVNETIDDMQAHIDDIVADVDSLEARVTANEDAILGLQAQNEIYDAQIGALIEQAAANSAAVADALLQLEDLGAQLLALQSDTVGNATAIANLEDQIAAQQDIISANAEGVQGLINDMENNNTTIAAMQEEIQAIMAALAQKQNILSGSCPAGTALTAIDPTGGITCETVGNGYTKFTVTRYASVRGYTRTRVADYCHSHGWSGYHCHYSYRYTYYTGTATATCPVGTLLTGGGYTVPYYMTLLSSASTWTAEHPANSWIVSARNNRSYGGLIYSRAECVRFP